MYKEDLALSNIQWLRCHKIKHTLKREYYQQMRLTFID